MNITVAPSFDEPRGDWAGWEEDGGVGGWVGGMNVLPSTEQKQMGEHAPPTTIMLAPPPPLPPSTQKAHLLPLT